MYIGADGKPDDRSITGDLAAGVPGSVAGLGKRTTASDPVRGPSSWRPRFELADSGFTVDSDFAAAREPDSDRLATFPASAALFLPHGHPLHPGDHWRNPQLAAMLRRIAAQDPQGSTPARRRDAIVAEMQRGHGIITRPISPPITPSGARRSRSTIEATTSSRCRRPPRAA